MAIIQVPDILVRKNNEWKSMRSQQVYKNGWKNFNAGCGVYKNSNWYVLGPPSFIVVGQSGHIIKVK